MVNAAAFSAPLGARDGKQEDESGKGNELKAESQSTGKKERDSEGGDNEWGVMGR